MNRGRKFDNPIVRHMYTADPSAHVWDDGRLYVYPSHDIDPPRGCDLMDRYHVFSTDDLDQWTDHGEILAAKDVEWGRPEGGFMWAPDCAYKNGTYYFYFPHPSESDWNRSWKIGVATSEKPASDFKSRGYIPGLGGFAMIDPAVFVDDDGQAYLAYGGGGHCHVGRLRDSMLEIHGEMRDVSKELDDYHEGPWLFRRQATYYLMYADNHVEVSAGADGREIRRGANRLRYATSRTPLGPWTSRGIVLGPTDCDTSHGSIVEYRGKWYLFYHDSSLSGDGCLRSVCVAELFFDPDGAIQPLVRSKG